MTPFSSRYLSKRRIGSFQAPGLYLLALPVPAVVVVGGVGGHAVGLGLYERRPVAPARPRDRVPGGLVDGEHVVAVHGHAGEAVALGAGGDGAGT
jgi:hypothetical protein